MSTIPLKDFAPDAEDRKRFGQSFFGSVVGQTAVLVGLLVFCIGGMALIFIAWESLKPYWVVVGETLGFAWGTLLFFVVMVSPFVLVLLFNALPRARRLQAEKQAKAAAFEDIPEPPKSVFRLTPYGPGDREEYRRLDGQDAKALPWLRDARGSVFYFSGDSGVGKSSLIAASLVPALVEDGWAVLETRAYGNALVRLATELRARSDLFGRAPDAETPVRDLLGTIGDRRRRAGKPPLLVILDQFEEVLILADPERPDPFRALIEDLATNPLEGVKLLLVYRSDYETEIFKLNLPAPVPGRTAFRLGRYNRREAEQFLAAGGRLPGAEARAAMFGGLDRVEGAPGLYRQITLNMVGLFLERMGDRLTRDPDTLIQGYLEGSLREGEEATADARRRVLDMLVSDAGTKRPRREPEIVALTGLPPHVARAVLHGLAEKGLVRALDAAPGAERTWEVAHDFLAALLGRAVGRMKPTLWERARPAVGPLAIAGWVALILVGLPFWQQRTIASARAAIEDAGGSIHRTGQGQAVEVRFDKGRYSNCDQARPDWNHVIAMVGRIPDVENLSFVGASFETCLLPSALELWSSLSNSSIKALFLRGTPIETLAGMPALPALASLDLRNTPMDTLAGMPALPALASLDLRGTPIETLAGMPALPALASLDLRGIPIETLVGMPALPALASLNLRGTPIETLAGMPALPALASLDLRDTPIKTLAGMPALPALARLDLHGIETLAGMPALPALASLDLAYMPIDTLAGMPALPALASLDLRDTPIKTLAGMPALPALTSLDLFGAPIETLAGAVMPNLKTINIGATRIGTLYELSEFPTLERLDLNPHDSIWPPPPLVSLAGIEALPNLTWVDLRETRIRDLERLAGRDPMPEVLVDDETLLRKLLP